MCLILFAYQQHAEYRLVIAANRDEFYQRPSKPVHLWPDKTIYAGRDLQAGGTWLGINQHGHFSALTNFREPHTDTPALTSRGLLNQGFLSSQSQAEPYWQSIEAEQYAGFNLLLADRDGLAYYSNRSQQNGYLRAGIYGLSNAVLNTPWPKVESGKHDMSLILQEPPETWPNALFKMLQNTHQPTDAQLPDTGVGLELERLLAPRFIQSPNYGTRTSSVLLQRHDLSWDFYECNYESVEEQKNPHQANIQHMSLSQPA